MLDHLIEGRAPDLVKSKISEIVAETDMKLITGCDEELNLMHTIISIGQLLKPR